MASKKRRRDEMADTGPPEVLDETIEGLVKSVEIVNDDGVQFKVLSHSRLSKDRKAIYSRKFPEMKSSIVIACKCKEVADEEESELLTESSKIVEHLVLINRSSEGKSKAKAKPLLTECKISYEEVSPTQLVEYRFEETPTWYLSESTRPYLESFRASKFKTWKTMLMETRCRATLRSLLALGPITRLYDRFALPTPEDQKHLFETKDDNGKTVHIPHPVSELRVWDPEKGEYEVVKAHLEGSPETKEAVEKFWSETLARLREAHGEEFINKLLGEGLKKLKEARAKIAAALTAVGDGSTATERTSKASRTS
mmetsp:Transcript_9553/g.14334  ORF Transcript_9553/g.14334 Transcript_9553/m.14334 type:complete len:312 (+) Transcript_9553:104-1039(+)|eukprot:CAMPEP_0167752660 /NCGR_PEP_ID=MMETSP0110_2-20121227/7263_1 /TAXON_ID=629695 /ORGANISM="Gymnochlora sp., Strain CCMP2014" /LENGTH=311 /DNA_ID=CAMNT_0007638303 /DNA_START=94 /DNA_END=1029 /DNA_ORIENTATION=-